MNKALRINNSKFVFYSFFLCLTSVNTIWTPTQGWYYIWSKKLINETPYVDYYLPLPPLYVYLNRVFLLFPDPLLMERLMMVVVFVLMVSGFFQIMTLYFKQSISIVTTLLSSTLFQFSPTNTIAGYYEFGLMLLLWGFYFCHKKSLILQISGGILICCSSLTKQNFLGASMVLFFLFAWKILKKREIFWPAIGNMVGYLIFLCYLLVNGATGIFISTMLQGGGKNPNLISFLKNSAYMVSNQEIFVSSLTLLIVVYLTYCFGEVVQVRNKSFILCFLLVGIFIEVTLMNLSFPNTRLFLPIILGITLATSLAWIGMQKFEQKIKKNWHYLSLTTCLTFVSFEILSRISDKSDEIVGIGSEVSQKSFLQIENASTILGLYGLLLLIRKREIVNTQINAMNGGYLLISFFFCMILNNFNGGLTYSTAFYLFGFGIAYVMQGINLLQTQKFFQILGAGILAVICLGITLNIYAWYGWNEKFNAHVITEQKPQIFRNFFLTSNQMNIYKQINSSLDSIKKNTDNVENLRIISWPSQPIFSLMSSFEQYKSNCAIIHFDVCPENQAKIDLNYIKKDPPEIVIYSDSGIEFIRSEERMWRNGDISSQRKIREFLLYSNSYRVIREIPPTEASLNRIFILILREVPFDKSKITSRQNQ